MIAAPLTRSLQAVAELEPGSAVLPVLAAWARLPIPVPVVGGPLRTARADRDTSQGETDDHRRPIAVVLSSIDGGLVTGPEVLSPHTVHELILQVQADPWPEWAESLEAELLTHLTQDDATTPAFTWHHDDHTGDGETLTVLDMSPKTLPIGTPENHLFTMGPQLHGLEHPEAPSVVATLVVNGNLPTPSSWSRRRTPTSDDRPGVGD